MSCASACNARKSKLHPATSNVYALDGTINVLCTCSVLCHVSDLWHVMYHMHCEKLLWTV